MIYNWLKISLDSLYPPRCLLCGAPGGGGQDLCAGCRADLPLIDHGCPRCGLPLAPATQGPCGDCQQTPPPYGRLIAPLRYAPPVDRLGQDLKFNRRLSRARLLADLMLEAVTAAGTRAERIIPVPLHPRRLRRRGFNQALELARPLAEALGLELDCRSVRRLRATLTQADLDAAGRRVNMRDAFGLDGSVAGLRVAVVDDVVTTGHTVAELARLLIRHGAADVEVWAAARTPVPLG